MSDSDFIRDQRRQKFMEKIKKKDSTPAIFKTQIQNENQEKILSEVINNKTQEDHIINDSQANPNIKIQKIKLLKQDDNTANNFKDINNLNQNQATQISEINNSEALNYKDIYKKQKYFENLKDIICIARFSIFLIYGILHFFNFNIAKVIDFSKMSHLLTIITITETSFIYFSKSLENEKKKLINNLHSEPITQISQEKILMNILSMVEKFLESLNIPMNLLSDISTFIFANFLCYLFFNSIYGAKS